MVETSTPYTRFSEHLANYKYASAPMLPALPPDDSGGQRSRRKSWMRDHVKDSHSVVVGDRSVMGDFKVVVTGQYRKGFYQQIDVDIKKQWWLKGESAVKKKFYTPKRSTQAC